jgi:hypothetical protein
MKESEKELMQEMKRAYHDAGLHKVSRWNEGGKISYAYCDPKNKDIEKSRGIVSMAKHPAARLLRMVSKCVMWMMRFVPEGALGFTMKTLRELKPCINSVNERIRDFPTRIDKMYVQQFDVDQMYTNLNKDEIRDAVLWFFDKVRAGVQKYSRIYAREGNVAVRREGRKRFEMRWERQKGRRSNWILMLSCKRFCLT